MKMNPKQNENSTAVLSSSSSKRNGGDFRAMGRANHWGWNSTVAWSNQFFSQCDANHAGIVERFEHTARLSANAETPAEATDDSDPINILCFDGGGMRGYCHATVLAELQRMMGDDDDLLQYFDMACGTSVGGVAALMAGQYGTNKKLISEATNLLDRIREDSFKKFNFFTLLSQGSLTSGQDRMAAIYEETFQDTPLRNPGGLKAFALCTARDDSGPVPTFEPFVLRSYDLRDEDENSAIMEEKNDEGMSDELKEEKAGEDTNILEPVQEEDSAFSSSASSSTLSTIETDTHPEETKRAKEGAALKFDGTNEVLLWEAMAATSAAPVLTGRVQLTLNGETRRVADGCCVSNSPVEIAISEARRLWPNRPFGIILSLGLDKISGALNMRSIEAVRRHHSPDLKYLRLNPNLEGFVPTVTDSKKIQAMQQVALEHAQGRVDEIRPILEQLKASTSRVLGVTKTEKSMCYSSKKNGRMSAWFAPGHKTTPEYPGSGNKSRQSMWKAFGAGMGGRKNNQGYTGGAGGSGDSFRLHFSSRELFGLEGNSKNHTSVQLGGTKSGRSSFTSHSSNVPNHSKRQSRMSIFSNGNNQNTTGGGFIIPSKDGHPSACVKSRMSFASRRASSLQGGYCGGAATPTMGDPKFLMDTIKDLQDDGEFMEGLRDLLEDEGDEEDRRTFEDIAKTNHASPDSGGSIREDPASLEDKQLKSVLVDLKVTSSLFLDNSNGTEENGCHLEAEERNYTAGCFPFLKFCSF